MEENVKVGAAWLGDWRQRLFDRLVDLGFDRLTPYAKTQEAASLSEIIKKLGEPLAPVQIEQVLREEVHTQEDFNYFVRTMLVRNLKEECPTGWKCHGLSALSLAITGWGTSLGKYRGAPHPWLRIANKLKARDDLPTSWLPYGVRDPVIVDIFQGEEFIPYSL